MNAHDFLSAQELDKQLLRVRHKKYEANHFQDFVAHSWRTSGMLTTDAWVPRNNCVADAEDSCPSFGRGHA